MRIICLEYASSIFIFTKNSKSGKFHSDKMIFFLKFLSPLRYIALIISNKLDGDDNRRSERRKKKRKQKSIEALTILGYWKGTVRGLVRRPSVNEKPYCTPPLRAPRPPHTDPLTPTQRRNNTSSRQTVAIGLRLYLDAMPRLTVQARLRYASIRLVGGSSNSMGGANS